MGKEAHGMIAGRNGILMSSALTLQSLPLFPLGTVLFPGGLLPLRIFEVRYLDMIGRCHKAGSPFGVVSLIQGSEVRQPGSKDSFSSVGTLATISGFDAPRPGLMVIRASGAQRFRITSSDQLKHGLYSPGMHIPVVPAERVLQDQPDDLLILAWNFGDEIMQQQAEYQRRGGKFILPIPEPRIVG